MSNIKNTKPRKEKVMNRLTEITGGKSYKAHKFLLGHADCPLIDYGTSEIIWKRRAETTPHITYIDLTNDIKQLTYHNDQLLNYFLEGSRRVFKVGDITFAQLSGISIIYLIIAKYIGIAFYTVNQ